MVTKITVTTEVIEAIIVVEAPATKGPNPECITNILLSADTLYLV